MHRSFRQNEPIVTKENKKHRVKQIFTLQKYGDLT